MRPLVTVVAVGGTQLVAAVNQAAEMSGLSPGMALADARTLAPELIVVPHTPEAALQDLARLAGWCTRYTPWTAIEQTDEGSGAGLWLDLSGCAHLFGGETALLADLEHRLAALGLTARAAIADTPGAAWAWARFAQTGIHVIAPSAQREALAGLPTAALRLSAAIVDRLNSLGLRTIGHLYRLPRAALATRFGAALLLRLDQALGSSDEPITPHQPPLPCRASLAFAEPILTADAIAVALRRLVHDLCGQLARQEKGARRLVLTAYRSDGTTASLMAGTNQPTRDPPHLLRLFLEQIERLDPAPGLDATALAAETGALTPGQSPLGLDGARTTTTPDLTQLFDVLGLRLGHAQVMRLAARASHVPERAVARINPAAPPRASSWPIRQPRPLRLLARPEPIDVMALVPDAPPLQFVWRRVTHRIKHAEGPERIAGEWWQDDLPLRDYYRVEDETGRRFWVYREGLYQPDQRVRWYLHGMFA